MKTIVTLVGICALGLGLVAHADTRMSFTTAKSGNTQLAIKGDRIRIQGAQGNAVTLFDAASQQITVIEPAKRRYYHMDMETLKRQGQQLSEQMRQMQQQMEQQLQNLPESQREMMRKQMEQMMPAQAQGAMEDIRIERNGTRDKVAGVACERIAVYQGGSVVQRACVAQAGDLGIAQEDLATMRKMFESLAEMTQGFRGFAGATSIGGSVSARVASDVDGIPIEATDAQGNMHWALQSVDTGSLDAAEFQVPAGYQEVEQFGGSQ